MKILIAVCDIEKIGEYYSAVSPFREWAEVFQVNSLEDAWIHAGTSYCAVIFAGEPPAPEVVKFLLSRVRKTIGS